MAEEQVDKHVLRKYEVLQKLGKGVNSHLVARSPKPSPPSGPIQALFSAGIWCGLEGYRQEDPEYSSTEEDL